MPVAGNDLNDPPTPSGELFSVAPLDREQESQHPLVVKATDGGGRSCQADVLLLVQDANDNPPHFSTGNLRVTIFDNTTVHTPVAVLRASDPDTGQISTFFFLFLFNSFCGTVDIGKGKLAANHKHYRPSPAGGAAN